MISNNRRSAVGFLVLSLLVSTTVAFQTPLKNGVVSDKTYKNSALHMAYYTKGNHGRSTPRGGRERSLRQERVGHVVRSEIASILHRGVIKGDADFIDTELRERISVVNADVSPDLRQARITVSVMKSNDEDNNHAVDRRRAYSWLVRNTKPIRHTMAQRLKHMKTVPNLSFIQADVSAAVDVMYLIDKVSTSGYRRDDIDSSVPQGVFGGIDFDDDDDDWDDEDFDLEDDEE
mmetsp:Transcript_1777/g.2398  ORF Transcript_1777/g.2398 Transcript_1777/m.2398 type:complete len:233 (+) Transcript_1777:16-714(+)|eukprot:CAMPEP_0195283172 /NCGR_PEP_ID=MMETSP0707-20130614/1807_1 /TAXON_ID=33640 /ORGANISM="Asterionellopsis glacialis, Strain CCMP134" /LENGTH=232 /DNA_ID=CAMNT_0040342297 /DNA_START=30 /DNA_END=728 /DNA_ORIENTATION=-